MANLINTPKGVMRLEYKTDSKIKSDDNDGTYKQVYVCRCCDTDIRYVFTDEEIRESMQNLKQYNDDKSSQSK